VIRMESRQLFNNKLSLIQCDPFALHADTLVSFVGSDAGDYQERLSKLPGDECWKLYNKYSKLAPGNCRLIKASSSLPTYKYIAYAVLPPLFSQQNALNRYQLSLCYRNALDTTAEANLRTIVFPHDTSGFADVEIVLTTFYCWLERSPYAAAMENIIVCCAEAKIFRTFTHVAEMIMSNDPQLALPQMEPEIAFESCEPEAPELEEEGEEVIMACPENEYYVMTEDKRTMSREHEFSSNTSTNDCNGNDFVLVENGSANTPEDARLLADVSASSDRGIAVYNQMYGSPSGIRLHLSRNLSSTILTIEQPDGFLRQYRMTTQSKEKDAFYFRCSRCESLLKNGYGDFRPKITVRDGVIQGNRFPPHHPDCHPTTKQCVVIQQMDRQARVRISNDGADPRDIYEHVKQAVVDDEQAEFPEWNKIRKQYFRIKKASESPYNPQRLKVTDRILSFPECTTKTELHDAVRECDNELEMANQDQDYRSRTTRRTQRIRPLPPGLPFLLSHVMGKNERVVSEGGWTSTDESAGFIPVRFI
jgi:O-acetyl-ADP-ribose deacetylase (regulator of RNase III)